MSKGKLKTMKNFKGKQKQAEGFTPRNAMPAGKKAGGAKAREKRLGKVAM